VLKNRKFVLNWNTDFNPAAYLLPNYNIGNISKYHFTVVGTYFERYPVNTFYSIFD
jgi:hypothetical protein